MNEADLLELLAIAREAAAAGARELEARSRHLTGVRAPYSLKASSIDLVTDTDRASEAAVLPVLARSKLPIVAEESAQGIPDADAIWYVDPLDGTTNFAHGHPFHCVSVGLAIRGAPRLGVVHAPALGTVWSAVSDLRGSRRDLFRGKEQWLAVSEVPEIEQGLLATGFPIDRRESDDDNTGAFTAVLKRAHGVLRCGSAALDLALVADGTFDAYWERKLGSWDVCAGAALVLAAGGKVTDPWGRPLIVPEGRVLASNGRVHGALLGAIARHQPEPPPR